MCTKNIPILQETGQIFYIVLHNTGHTFFSLNLIQNINYTKNLNIHKDELKLRTRLFY